MRRDRSRPSSCRARWLPPTWRAPSTACCPTTSASSTRPHVPEGSTPAGAPSRSSTATSSTRDRSSFPPAAAFAGHVPWPLDPARVGAGRGPLRRAPRLRLARVRGRLGQDHRAHRSAARRFGSRAPTLVYEVEADGFLRKMVRSLVGGLVAAGRGAVTVDDLRAALEARDRRAGRPPPRPEASPSSAWTTLPRLGDNIGAPSRVPCPCKISSTSSRPDPRSNPSSAPSTSRGFPATSRSSWTATAAGRSSATSSASRGTGPASPRCGTWSRRRRGSASRS